MVDFRKHLSGKKTETVIDPVKLYDTLDRAHDKGPLRPAQSAVLDEWHSSHREKRDIIVKLHTGQGKTCDQAKQFGIATCIADPDLPTEFLNGDKILVTSVHKLFNGLTKFGLHTKSISIGTFLMDDAHACSDTIRKACQIRVPNDDSVYTSLISLFATELEQQGVGTFADICNAKYDAILPVPYWAWMNHESDVAYILSSNSSKETIKFSWPLLKNILGNCQCVVSSSAIEIEPYIPPLDAFGTYWNASHRIFMSATVTDDAFLVKGLHNFHLKQS